MSPTKTHLPGMPKLLDRLNAELKNLDAEIKELEQSIEAEKRSVASMEEKRDQLRTFIEHAMQFAGDAPPPPVQAAEQPADPPPSPREYHPAVVTPSELMETVADLPPFDGGMSSLIACFRGHLASPYFRIKGNTRESYDRLLSRIKFDCEGRLVDLDAQKIQDLYDYWTHDGKKLPMGLALVTMLRALVRFGAETLRDPQCEQLQVVLHRFRCKPPENRK